MKLGGSLVDGRGAVSEPQNFVGILVSYIISLLFSAVEGVLERPLQNRMTNAMVNDQMTIAQCALWVTDT